jgi:LPXTG-motif cell wall-anchored protein
MQTTLPSEGGGESFLSTYKWPIIGGVAALAAIGVGVVVMKKRKNKGIVR